MSWKPSEKLLGNIGHYASFPPTGVSLRQMVQFGEKPSIGMKTHMHPREVLLTYSRHIISSLSVPL
jgi:hypothetical protein